MNNDVHTNIQTLCQLHALTYTHEHCCVGYNSSYFFEFMFAFIRPLPAKYKVTVGVRHSSLTKEAYI